MMNFGTMVYALLKRKDYDDVILADTIISQLVAQGGKLGINAKVGVGSYMRDGPYMHSHTSHSLRD